MEKWGEYSLVSVKCWQLLEKWDFLQGDLLLFWLSIGHIIKLSLFVKHQQWKQKLSNQDTIYVTPQVTAFIHKILVICGFV